ncbi:MAG: hypothetical protein IPL23_24180 [Saprospiraceae bacterium]|nr:hypothetical protein [Saprospiraceae bacterium]
MGREVWEQLYPLDSTANTALPPKMVANEPKQLGAIISTSSSDFMTKQLYGLIGNWRK